MAAHFPSLKQCYIQILKLGSNNIVIVQLDVKYFCMR